MEEEIKQYFENKNPVNVGKVLSVDFISDGNSSNHLNYKVSCEGGIYLARVTKPGELLSYSNMPDEYTILKLVEDFNVGPKALHLDLENFKTPILIEEFIEGNHFSSLKDPSENVFAQMISLLEAVSNIRLSAETFPFKFSYTKYKTSFKTWHLRIEEIAKSIGGDHSIIGGFKSVISKVEPVLLKLETILDNSPKEFIYNDVHPGNTFWLPREEKVKFIDWQKVSLGDPSFMAALFARRFGHIWGIGEIEFTQKVFNEYQKGKNISHFADLFRGRILERAVSDMIWVVWADAKKGLKIKDDLSENKYYQESGRLIEAMS